MTRRRDPFKTVTLWNCVTLEIPGTWDCFYIADERRHYGLYEEEDDDTGTVWAYLDVFKVPEMGPAEAGRTVKDRLADSPAKDGDGSIQMLPSRSDTHHVRLHHYESVDENGGERLLHIHVTHMAWVPGRVYMLSLALMMTRRQAEGDLHDLCQTIIEKLAAAEIDFEAAAIPGHTRHGPPVLDRFRRVLFWEFLTLDLPEGWEPFLQERGSWICHPLEGDRDGALVVDFAVGKMHSEGGGPLPDVSALRAYLEAAAEQSTTPDNGRYEKSEIVEIAPGEAVLRQTWTSTLDGPDHPMTGTSWLFARWDPPDTIHVYLTLYLPASPPDGNAGTTGLAERLEAALRHPKIDWATARKQIAAGRIAPPQRQRQPEEDE